MNVLLHICCGPCAIYPLQALRAEEGVTSVTGHFFNPNIHPYKEFQRRLDTLRSWAQEEKLELLTDTRYLLEEFLTGALERGANRCSFCYEMRLFETAKQAKENGFDAFTTTLLVSPYQNQDTIAAAAELAAKEDGVPFLRRDFRSGWQEGVRISREREMYRQPYCGCVLSERDRYEKKPKNE